MSPAPEVLVVGAGPNGLFAACRLARAGLRVLVCEAADRPGGALWDRETTLPGFHHDVGAGFVAFRDSAAFRALNLEQYGLRWGLGEVESAHPALDGTCPVIARQGARADSWGEDASAWQRLVAAHAQVDERLLGVMGTLPAWGAVARLVSPSGLRLAAMAAARPASFSRATFRTEAARRVLPGMGMHVDLAPEDAFGAAIGYMLSLRATTAGFAVPIGGAGAVTRALLADLAAHGGVVRTGARVAQLVCERGRVVAARLADGEEIRCRGAVCDTSAPALYLGLLGADLVGARVARRMTAFPRGWGAFKLDIALSGPVPWSAEGARRAAVVHAGEDLFDLQRFADQIRGGRLPERPYLVIGQQSLVDPSRAPAGQHTLYVYTRVPSSMPGGWEPHRSVLRERILDRIEGLAPGFRSQLLEVATHDPSDLESMSANLVGGDLGGGTNQWWNQAFFRPVFPYFRYRTPVAGAWLCSMDAHPGTGIHGMCGWNAAEVALADLGAA